MSEPLKTLLNTESTIIYGKVPLVGPFAAASIAKVTYNQEAWVLVVGADGSATRVQVPDGSARLEVYLQQSSQSNKYLTAKHYEDQVSGIPSDLLFDNPRSGVKYQATTAWITKIPDDEFGTAVGERTWVFETDNMKAVPL